MTLLFSFPTRLTVFHDPTETRLMLAGPGFQKHRKTPLKQLKWI
jgi:hypothetical protein